MEPPPSTPLSPEAIQGQLSLGKETTGTERKDCRNSPDQAEPKVQPASPLEIKASTDFSTQKFAMMQQESEHLTDVGSTESSNNRGTSANRETKMIIGMQHNKNHPVKSREIFKSTGNQYPRSQKRPITVIKTFSWAGKRKAAIRKNPNSWF